MRDTIKRFGFCFLYANKVFSEVVTKPYFFALMSLILTFATNIFECSFEIMDFSFVLVVVRHNYNSFGILDM